MCGRYVLVNKEEVIERKFNVESRLSEPLKPNYNIGAAQHAPIICSDNDKELVSGYFGYRPSWNPKLLLLNARLDKLMTSAEWRNALANNRCLIPASCFYEGPEREKLSKPYLVYMRETERPFAFAGIYRDIEGSNGEIKRTFAIITTKPSTVLRKIGHPRAPVVLHNKYIRSYLDNRKPLAHFTEALTNDDNHKMNAYPVSVEMRSGKVNRRELLDPIGQRVIPEYDVKTYQELEMHFGRRKKP